MEPQEPKPSNPGGVIPLAPIFQAPFAKTRQEDWSGTSDQATRRKLQNRLNQRASRNRRGLDAAHNETALPEAQKETREAWYRDVSKMMQPVPTTLADNWVTLTRTRNSPLINGTLTVDLSQRRVCIKWDAREGLLHARDFEDWLACQKTPFGISLNLIVPPFSADHLLTLTHFNTIRGMLSLVVNLGVDPSLMREDIMSPFVGTAPGPNRPLLLDHLPQILQPTDVQRTIPHHPELDVLPLPAARDNLIRAHGSYDDYELCIDAIGLSAGSTSITEELSSEYEQSKYSAGLLVWGDPCLQDSWEVTEEFAKKWKWIFVGGEDVFRSTNRWRSLRGERPLVFEELS